MDYEHSAAAWAEAFTIFAKYTGDNWLDIAAEHDSIWAGPDAERVSDEDKKRLDALGWTPADEGGFQHYV